MAKKTIFVKGKEITLLTQGKAEDYVSLTDIMKSFEDEFAIYSWMRNKNTVEYIGTWEQIHNTDFKPEEFLTFWNEAGSNAFNLTPKKWIDATDAIGMSVKAGRYGGGTFAHRDIAMHFCGWLSPTFQLYLNKEFQRLKEEEQKRLHLDADWNIKRMLSKVNYRFHTDAIRHNLIPPRVENTKAEGFYFASEADLLNTAIFGISAKQWREQNPDIKGNLRDNANAEQLLILANLENLNAEFIHQGLSQAERLTRLNEIAIYQMAVLVEIPAMKLLE